MYGKGGVFVQTDTMRLYLWSAGPDLSTFRLAPSRPELRSIMCATVRSSAARAAT